MSNTNQNLYPDDSEPTGPVDESGLVGEANSPDNTGLVGSPNSPDNSGLEGSGQIDIAGNTGYGTDTGGNDQTGLAGTSGARTDTTGGPSNTGVYGASTTGPSNTSNTGTYGSGADTDMSGAGTSGTGTGRIDYSGSNSAELPEQQLLQPGYDPQVGDAGRLQDLEREGPNPTSYGSDSDQATFANRDDENAPAGPDADMRSNETDQQTGY